MSIHAKQRAKERYGLDLTDKDINNIITQCIEKKEAVEVLVINERNRIFKNPRTKTYRLIYKNVILECVIQQHKNGHYILITFNQPPTNLYSIGYTKNALLKKKRCNNTKQSNNSICSNDTKHL